MNPDSDPDAVAAKDAAWLAEVAAEEARRSDQMAAELARLSAPERGPSMAERRPDEFDQLHADLNRVLNRIAFGKDVQLTAEERRSELLRREGVVNGNPQRELMLAMRKGAPVAYDEDGMPLPKEFWANRGFDWRRWPPVVFRWPEVQKLFPAAGPSLRDVVSEPEPVEVISPLLNARLSRNKLKRRAADVAIETLGVEALDKLGQKTRETKVTEFVKKGSHDRITVTERYIRKLFTKAKEGLRS